MIQVLSFYLPLLSRTLEPVLHSILDLIRTACLIPPGGSGTLVSCPLPILLASPLLPECTSKSKPVSIGWVTFCHMQVLGLTNCLNTMLRLQYGVFKEPSCCNCFSPCRSLCSPAACCNFILASIVFMVPVGLNGADSVPGINIMGNDSICDCFFLR